MRTSRTSVRPFDLDDVDAVKQQIAGVELVAGNASASETAFYNGQDWDTRISGVNNDFLKAQSIDVIEGRSFSSDEEISGKNVCLLGSKVREAIFYDVNPLGEQIRLGQVSCTVIGLLEERSGWAYGRGRRCLYAFKECSATFSWQ